MLPSQPSRRRRLVWFLLSAALAISQHRSHAAATLLEAYLRVHAWEAGFEISVTSNGTASGPQTLVARCLTGCGTADPLIDQVQGRILGLYRAFDGTQRVFATWRVADGYLIQVYELIDGTMRKRFAATSSSVPRRIFHGPSDDRLILSRTPHGQKKRGDEYYDWSAAAGTYVLTE